jgi:hypothetical protein
MYCLLIDANEGQGKPSLTRGSHPEGEVSSVEWTRVGGSVAFFSLATSPLQLQEGKVRGRVFQLFAPSTLDT